MSTMLCAIRRPSKNSLCLPALFSSPFSTNLSGSKFVYDSEQAKQKRKKKRAGEDRSYSGKTKRRERDDDLSFRIVRVVVPFLRSLFISVEPNINPMAVRSFREEGTTLTSGEKRIGGGRTGEKVEQ